MKKYINVFAFLIGVSINSYAASSVGSYQLTDQSFEFAAPVAIQSPANPDTTNPVGSIVYDATSNVFKGLFLTGWAPINQGTAKAPTVTICTGTTGSYTTPAGVLYLRVRMVGAGGGGSGGGVTGATAGSNGTSTTFGTSLLVANGGAGGLPSNSGQGGTGGTASLGVGPVGTAITGGFGQGAALLTTTSGQFHGGSGASTPFGGAGLGGGSGAIGLPAIANTGSGGGGGGISNVANAWTGSGGGAGGYVDAIIRTPASSYAYAIGVKGAAGSGGTSGLNGGPGSDGYIEVTEYYQ